MTTTTKHLINAIENSVYENLLGLVSTNHSLQVIPECNSVIRKDFLTYRQKSNVLLISGGGSGHEPMFAGFVGSGLLTGAVAGNIFASPPPRRTLRLIETIADKSVNEILIIIANYTGDRLNFGLAREHAILNGYNVDVFIFGEDVAFYGEGKSAGRRGLAGITFVHKLAGALAEEGNNMKQIKEALNNYSPLIGTISISLNSCNIPGLGNSFDLAFDEIELGLGVHGEAGVERMKLSSARDVVSVMLQHLVGKTSPLFESIKKYNNRIVILFNNTGGLSMFELNIIINETITQLEALDLQIERLYFGSFMTSFGMSGVSITAMTVDNKMLHLLDRPSSSSAWNQLVNTPKILNRSTILKTQRQSSQVIDFESIDGLKFGKQLFLKCIELSCKALISHEKYLNELDTQLGDGDCGSTLSTTAKHLLQLISNNELKPSFIQLSQLCENNMGGTSGAIYSLMFTAASQAVRANNDRIDEKTYDYLDFWRDVIKYSLDTITRYSSAKPGDRSMLDSLYSVYQVLDSCDHNLTYNQIANLVSKGAKSGAESTAAMKASVGRASYVNLDKVTKPDPGAIAVSIWINAIAQAFNEFDNKV